MSANTIAAPVKNHDQWIFESHYIGGQWVRGSANEQIPVESAYSGDVVGSVPRGTTADVVMAVTSAAKALVAWSESKPTQRIDFLRKIASGLEARANELTRMIALEVGMPAKLTAKIQVGLPIEVLKSYAAALEKFSFKEQVGNSLVFREPVGVVVCITPWNYPLHQIIAKIAAALAAGCTVVLKPSEIAPLNAFVLAEVIHEAGVPAGVFNLVSGFGAEIGEELVTNEIVQMISFTGSTETGKLIAKQAANFVKKVSLELGGKSASIILDDADLQRAVKATVNNCFLNSGQTCTAQTRMLVPEAQYEEACKLAAEAASTFRAGDPFDPDVKMGPLVSRKQRDQVAQYVSRGLADGAKIVFASSDQNEGNIIGPIVLGNVQPHHTVAQEEIFGPVLSIIKYSNEDEAIKIANCTQYGLAGAVWSNDEDRALRIARQMKAGQIDINGGPFNLQAPFGGMKQSGNGRELGTYGLEEFLEYKSVQFKNRG